MLESEPGDGLMRRGVHVFVGLALLTALEFGIALSDLSDGLLIIIALVKVMLILVYYMHIRGVFNLDKEGEH